METIYFTKVETAKLIRQDLKMQFSGVKFSVRYAKGQSAIYVDFAGTHLFEKEVENFLERYRGLVYDAHADYWAPVTHNNNGKEVYYEVDHIFTRVDVTGFTCLCKWCEKKLIN